MGKWRDRFESQMQAVDRLNDALHDALRKLIDAQQEIAGYKELLANERTGHAETWQKVVRAKTDAVQCAREAKKLDAELTRAVNDWWRLPDTVITLKKERDAVRRLLGLSYKTLLKRKARIAELEAERDATQQELTKAQSIERLDDLAIEMLKYDVSALKAENRRLESVMHAYQRDADKYKAERDNAYKTNERLRYELHALQERKCWTCNAHDTCQIQLAAMQWVDRQTWCCSEWQARDGD